MVPDKVERYQMPSAGAEVLDVDLPRAPSRSPPNGCPYTARPCGTGSSRHVAHRARPVQALRPSPGRPGPATARGHHVRRLTEARRGADGSTPCLGTMPAQRRRHEIRLRAPGIIGVASIGIWLRHEAQDLRDTPDTESGSRWARGSEPCLVRWRGWALALIVRREGPGAGSAAPDLAGIRTAG